MSRLANSPPRIGQLNARSNISIPMGIEPLGITYITGNPEKQLILRVADPHGQSFTALPLSDLISSERKYLALLMAERGHFHLTERTILKDLAKAMIHEAQSKTAVLLSQNGHHEIKQGSQCYHAYVWNGKAYWFGDKPKQEIVVMTTAPQARQAGSLMDWQVKIGEKLSGNPYLIVTHTHALSAAIRRALGLPPLTLSLVGPSSIGKTTTQNSAQSQIGPVSGVRTMSGTPAGVRELVMAHPDVPLYFQDTRQFPTQDLVDLIFDAADGAMRMVSGQPRAPLAATLIMSNERHIVDMPKSRSLMLDEGFFARCLEISCIAPYGAFHCLHGMPSPADFARQLDSDSRDCYGTVWPAWLQALSENWPKVLHLYAKWGTKVRNKLIAKVGDHSNTRISNRILDGLSFSAWVGVIASYLNILPITRDEVIDAYVLVFQQLLAKQCSTTSPLANQLFDKLKTLLAESSSKFDNLASFNQEGGKSGLFGYRTNHKRHGRLYLFLPNVFKDRFVDQFGGVAYALLAEAGHLVTGKTRGHQLLVRIPGTEYRASFVAIKESIRYD